MPTDYSVSDIYRSRWLKADDIAEDDLVVTISDVNAEQIGQDKQSKLVLSFKESEKAMVLNKTNARSLSEKFGDDPNDWIGKRIGLFATEVDFAGKTTLAIRIRKKTPSTSSPVQEAQSKRELGNSEESEY